METSKLHYLTNCRWWYKYSQLEKYLSIFWLFFLIMFFRLRLRETKELDANIFLRFLYNSQRDVLTYVYWLEITLTSTIHIVCTVSIVKMYILYFLLYWCTHYLKGIVQSNISFLNINFYLLWKFWQHQLSTLYTITIFGSSATNYKTKKIRSLGIIVKK